MNCRVDFLRGNRRYRIMHMDGQHYIFDIEKYIWLIFIPILLWLMPQKMYKIDEEILEQLKTPTSSSGNSLGIIIFGAGGAAILTPIVQPILDHTIESTFLVNLVLLIGATAFIIFLRLYLSKVLRNQLYKKVNISNLETVTIKIRPKYFRQYSTPFFFWSFTGVINIGMFYFFLVNSDLIPLVVFLIILPLSLFLNWTVINPDFGKTNLYHVSIDN